MYDFSQDPMYGAMMFTEETWNSCIKLIEGALPSELSTNFEEAAIWLGKFREILIGKIERLENKDNIDMDKVLDWINKSKKLEQEFWEAVKRQRPV